MKLQAALLFFAASLVLAQGEYFPAIGLAQFTGPKIVGEFSFYQDNSGLVTATGALQKGLSQDVDYYFSFREGSSCEDLGSPIYEHSFDGMHVSGMGATAAIQEPLEGIRLTGPDGILNMPWVLSDSERDLACVIVKNQAELGEL
ncbi:hypothetical protein K501DRAFT_184694 [Backusella circina FSU 941]|nr:hypothetical protein K501DRAFT_184694 [Backusella circina FSU 941]